MAKSLTNVAYVPIIVCGKGLQTMISCVDEEGKRYIKFSEKPTEVLSDEDAIKILENSVWVTKQFLANAEIELKLLKGESS